MKTPREVIADCPADASRKLGHDFAHHIEERLGDAGYVIVPKEPTFQMWDQAENASVMSETDLQFAEAKRNDGKALDEYESDLLKEAFSFPTFRIWQLVVGYRAMITEFVKAQN